MSNIQQQVEERLAKAQENKEYKDKGKRVHGAAKERAAYRVITAQQLAEMEENKGLAFEMIKKDKIFPKINVPEEKDKGVSPAAVYLKMELRKSIATNPPNNAMARKIYVEYIGKILDLLPNIKTAEEFEYEIRIFKTNSFYALSAIILPSDVHDYFDQVDSRERSELTATTRHIQELIEMGYGNDILEGDKAEWFKKQMSEATDHVTAVKNNISTNEQEWLKAINKIYHVGSFSYIDTDYFARKILEAIFGKRFSNFNSSISTNVREAREYDGLTPAESEKLIAEYKPKKEAVIQSIKEKIYKLENVKSSDELHALLEKSTWIFQGGDLADYVRGKVRYSDVLALKKRNPEKYFQAAEEYKKRVIRAEQKNLIAHEEEFVAKLKKLQPRPDNWGFADTKTKEGGAKRSELVINKGKPLDFIKRIGGIDTTDVVTAEAADHYMTNVLGFKSFTFGKTLKDEDAQQHMRHFIGAMADLGEMLNMDIAYLNSMNKYSDHGGLSFALGAFSGGGFAAFYQRGQVFINLTKTRGQGTIAHEYAHYIDNALCWIDNPSYEITKEGEGNFGSNSKYSFTQGWGNPARMSCFITNREVCKKMAAIMTYIKTGSVNIAEGGKSVPVKKLFKVPTGAKKYTRPTFLKDVADIDSAIEQLRIKYNYFNKWEKLTQKDKDILGAVIASYGFTEYEVEFLVTSSNFYARSSMVGSEYWIRDQELFARAQETYIFDKLKKAGRENNYLVSGGYFDDEEGVYPVGEERETLFYLYDDLYITMKREYKIPDFKPWTDVRIDDYIILDKKEKTETVKAEVVVDVTTEQLKTQAREKLQKFLALLMLIDGGANS